MSEFSSDSEDGILFENRTTYASFNERLMQAKADSDFNPVNDSTRFEDFYASDDTEELKKLLDGLKTQVERMESRVENMETKLAARREKRNKEANLTNLTPEERAAYVAEEEEAMTKSQEANDAIGQGDLDLEERSENEEDAILKAKRRYGQRRNIGDNTSRKRRDKDDPDWDVVYEYILLMESQSADDSNMLSSNDFLNPHADIRKEALYDRSVKEQTEYSSIAITKAKNVLENNTMNDGAIRHCTLEGTSNDIPFSVRFDVKEPDMTISNIKMDVDIEMQLTVGNVLQKIKEESNLMGFFRLLVHFARLEKQREATFQKLLQSFEDAPVKVGMLSRTKLQFEAEGNCGIKLLFNWRTLEANLNKELLDANIENHVLPDLTLEAVASPDVIERDEVQALDKVNEGFLYMAANMGVFGAVEYIVNKLLLDK